MELRNPAKTPIIDDRFGGGKVFESLHGCPLHSGSGKS